MAIDRVRHLKWSAKIIRKTLTRLGYASKHEDGTPWEISFCDALYYQPRDAGLLEVDVHRLPHKTKVATLSSDDVLHELSTAVGGLRVEARNRRGLVYIVRFTEPEKPAEVKLPRRVDLDLTERPRGVYMVPLGVGADGPRWVSLLDLLNVLAGGEPGAGKSMLLNTWLAALTMAYTPQELRLTLIDPKRVEMAGWRHLPHLAGDITTTVEEAEQALDLLLDELDHRANLMQAVGARNLAGYNKQAAEPLPLHLVIVDELTDLALSAGGVRSDLFKKLIRCASTGRALGMLFVMATQSPRAEVINTTLKAAMNTRIAFRCASKTDSRVILDRPDGASIKRSTPGRLVALLDGKAQMFQSYYLADDVLAGIQRAGRSDVELLSDDERRIADIVQRDLNGSFIIDEIYEITGPKSQGGVSYRWLKETGRRWERRGWLIKDASDPTRPRVLTQVLTDLLAGTSEHPSEHVRTPVRTRQNTSEPSERQNTEAW